MNGEALNRFALGRKSFALWLVLFSASILLLIAEGDKVSLTASIVLLGAICVPSLLYQDAKFRRRTVDLLTKGVSLESYSYSRQIKLIGTITLLGFAALVGPVIMLGFVPADVWLGALIGTLDGWLLYLILFNADIWLWERRHVGFLYRVEFWNGTNVTHVGLKFRRHNNA